MEKGRVYRRGTSTSICVGAGVQWFFHLIVVDDVNFASPYENVHAWNCVRDVIVIIQGNNGSCNKAHVEDAGDD